MRSISFLLGSGFSVPAGYPKTACLNKRLSKIDASEINIHTSGDASFRTDPNAPVTEIAPRKFVEEFLDFYRKEVLKNRGFDYEKFFDYYWPFCEKTSCTGQLRSFLQKFRSRYRVQSSDSSLLAAFSKAFTQLIALELTKTEAPVHRSKPYAPACGAFLDLAEKLSVNHRVHIHTLNHDLYMESLASSDSIRGELDDGFEEVGSPFYGQVDTGSSHYNVRLSRFTDRYERRFCLYKLHGSIDFYWLQDGEGWHLVRKKRGASSWNMLKETESRGRLQYTNLTPSYFSEFLTGREAKLGRYDGEYYSTVLNHFAQNLYDARILIVIGYGFRDPKINEMFMSFLKEKNKTAFVIDIQENLPKTRYHRHPRVVYLSGGVEGMDSCAVLKKVAESCGE